MIDLEEYQLIIWDLDGTLYYQKEFRRKMMAVILKELCFSPGRWRELLLILYYRRLRETWDTRKGAEDMELRQYEKAGSCVGLSAREAEQIIVNWIHKKPLQYLRPFRDERAVLQLKKLQEEGKKVVVYSDYPTVEKLKALEIKVEESFSPSHPQIRCLKPDPRGIEFIVRKYAVEKSQVLMIGDRYEKDGQAALAAGIKYEILPRGRREREAYYRKNKKEK